MFNQFKDEQMKEVHRTSEELLDNKFTRYEKVCNKFSKFFSEEELIYQIDDKIDRKMFGQMDLLKASKVELEQTEQLICNLNDRVKHLSNLVCTLTKQILPVKN